MGVVGEQYCCFVDNVYLIDNVFVFQFGCQGSECLLEFGLVEYWFGYDIYFIVCEVVVIQVNVVVLEWCWCLYGGKCLC